MEEQQEEGGEGPVATPSPPPLLVLPPICKAAAQGSIMEVKALLSETQGGELVSQDSNGWTPLFHAAAAGNLSKNNK